MCRFFLNGGCIRGELCPYSHEFPDERHLDVNGVGFIFNTGVQNSGAAMQRRFQPQQQSSPVQQPPAYHVRQQSPQPQPLSNAMTQQTPPQAAVRTPVAPHPQYVAAPTYNAALPAVPAPTGIPVHYQPTSSIYTYGAATQPPPDLRPPPQAPPMMTSQMYVAAAAPPPAMHLQPRNGTTAPITVLPRTDVGPYAPPTPFPYALPPQLTVAYQHASIVPVSGYSQPAMVYSYPAQQHALYSAMMPAAASA